MEQPDVRKHAELIYVSPRIDLCGGFVDDLLYFLFVFLQWFTERAFLRLL